MAEQERKDEHDLVMRARDGDREAFGALVRKHRRRVYVTALQVTHNAADADDLTQEVFIRAYKALPRFDFRSDLFTWLYRITVNAALSLLGRAHRSRTLSLDDGSPLAVAVDRWLAMREDPRERLEARQLYVKALEALQTLKPELQVTLTLHVMQGLSHQEVAEVMDCAEGTVAWRINEARRQLRRKLRKELGSAQVGDELSRNTKEPLGLP
ncbi:MAG: sigma-70 family RNA polymerase sigma factor [Polyangia bacterium]|jgi:RNA polymerase sigma-70 factor (ECF subfamily)|nr:sigma-70 family RNA polymerase sigma factor [Polyangia bacterium]